MHEISTSGHIFLSFLLWLGAYKCCRLTIPERSGEFCNRLVTLVHGSITAFFGLGQCFMNDLLYEGPQNHTSLQKCLLVFSLGYFIFDLAWCLYYQSETNLMIAHHLFSCLSLTRIIMKEYSGSQSTCALGCMEISNPILQARWFARTYGYHHTPLFVSIEVTFMLVFITVRIFFGTFFLIVVMFHPYNNWEMRLISLALYVLSWMFVVNILKYVTSKYVQQQIISQEDDLPKSASS